MELRAFFGKEAKIDSHIVESTIKIDPSRSPFIRERIDVWYEGDSLESLREQVKNVPFSESTFKVMYIKDEKISDSEKTGLVERRRIEREIGMCIQGEPDLEKPENIYGVIVVEGRWIFGNYHKSEQVWLHHQQKPNDYSTALNTRVARAVANIAVPDPVGVKVIDPCCGIGTVVVEALSMGIDIVGSDVNPLVLPGARENIAHFGLACNIAKRDIREVTEQYDVVIIDMPYNLCSVISKEEQLEMLQSANRIADKLVVVTIEDIDSLIAEAGFQIEDRCELKKGKLVRQVIDCRKIIK
ncbi:methyltransferase domain-containing protein [Bacillus mesophilus]|uniref:Methyltransferase domain-containing protein n=2 Tax=Bacillus mesophilus TaxID=1808955 RepID=A0A6M0QCI6_9BACI|nr:methyltransferase domain-containing protein [Bacillus mesophilus]